MIHTYVTILADAVIKWQYSEQFNKDDYSIACSLTRNAIKSTSIPFNRPNRALMIDYLVN